ncbi:hypothetical protein H0S68_25460 (plasmid) [Serratia sp. AXJ-M]|uniref:scabin-related ADP-ribosyltransferase n=1 Tax=Serratia sp. AXJ-M TaxID=2754727 RepID=UPI003979F89D
MKKVMMFLVTLSFFLSLPSQAINILYRSDQRAPEEVFRYGFRNLGENDNILSHVEGESCISGTRDSAFVATTTSNTFAERFSRDVRAGDPFWVYSIRPSNNFYSVYSSLMYAYNASHNDIFRRTAETFSEQGEYAAFGGVESRQIMGAWLYRSNGPGVPATRLSYTVNPGYIDEDTHVNTEPYVVYYLPSVTSSLLSCESCVNSSSHSFYIKNNKGDLAEKIIYCKRLFYVILFD